MYLFFYVTDRTSLPRINILTIKIRPQLINIHALRPDHSYIKVYLHWQPERYLLLEALCLFLAQILVWSKSRTYDVTLGIPHKCARTMPVI